MLKSYANQYQKNLEKLLWKAKYLENIDNSNILWYGQFWEYKSKYYINNLLWDVTETSKETYFKLKEN